MTETPETALKPDSFRADARRTVRVAMQEYLRRDSLLPVLRLLLDLGFLAAAIIGACVFEAWWAKALMVVPASIAIARLFVIGHDACHGSYTKYDWLNKIVGRIAFLPSLTPVSLWDVGHNVAHHGFTNLKGRDQVWVPMSAEEWQAASKSAAASSASIARVSAKGSTTSSKCGGRNSSCLRRNTLACAARSSSGTTCWC
jgi:omega-6 fatty acid desaturase (delta-12 desaturase)